MKIVLTKISPPEERKSSEPITPEKGWKVSHLKDKAKGLFDGIEGYQVLHNGFELSKHYYLCDLEPDLDSDVIHLDLVKPAADEEAVHLNFVYTEWEDPEDPERGAVYATNESQVKFYILFEGSGALGGASQHHIERCQIGNNVKTFILNPYAQEIGDGMEFRFGVCAESDVIRGKTTKRYLYHLYKLEVTEKNLRNFSISLQRDNTTTRVMLTTPGEAPTEIEPFTQHPLETGKTERERYTNFKEVANYLLCGVVNFTGKMTGEALGDVIKDALRDGGVNVGVNVIEDST